MSTDVASCAPTRRTGAVGAAMVMLSLVFVTASCHRSRARDTGAMCKKIFTERTTGIITPFRVAGRDHEAEFMQLCVTLPRDYLQCEIQTANQQSATCARTLRESRHRRMLNAVLVSGHAPHKAADAAPTPRRSR